MGFGDVLMSSGEARHLHKQTKQPVIIVGRDGRPIVSELFEGLPYIVSRPPAGGPHQRLVNGPGHRPYIAGKTLTSWAWRKYQPAPAEIVFRPAELAFAEKYRGAIMVEPGTKSIGHPNKAWLLTRWQHLDIELRNLKLPVVHCGPPGTRFLNHATPVVTDNFRMACAVLSVCKAFIGTEGGLMHAAAAVGTPGVILWSEFISPEITGYSSHRNIRHAGKACGRRTECPSCHASMLAITVDEVLTNLKEILK